MDDKILIETVRNRREIYDKGHAGFKNPALKESAWLSIAEIVNASAAECVTRWNTLRERFVKEKRLVEAETRSGAGASQRQIWMHWNAMNFLKGHVRFRKSIDNLPAKISETFIPPSSDPSSASSSAEDDLDSLFQKYNTEEILLDVTNENPASQNSDSCPPTTTSTSTVEGIRRIASTKSAAASLPYFGSAGRCSKRKAPYEAMMLFKETLLNLNENIKVPATGSASQTATCCSDRDFLIRQGVTACLRGLTDPRTELRFRRTFKDLTQDCEESALDV